MSVCQSGRLKLVCHTEVMSHPSHLCFPLHLTLFNSISFSFHPHLFTSPYYFPTALFLFFSPSLFSLPLPLSLFLSLLYLYPNCFSLSLGRRDIAKTGREALTCIKTDRHYTNCKTHTHKYTTHIIYSSICFSVFLSLPRHYFLHIMFLAI